jgi:hypothetical protein
MAGGKWSRWGRGGCEGHTLDIGDFINFSLVRKDDRVGKFSHYEATCHTRKIDEFASLEEGKKKIEEELESGMRRVLHDWETYQQNKAKRPKA